MVLISEQQVNSSVKVRYGLGTVNFEIWKKDTHRGLYLIKKCKGVAQEARKLQYLWFWYGILETVNNYLRHGLSHN